MTKDYLLCQFGLKRTILGFFVATFFYTTEIRGTGIGLSTTTNVMIFSVPTFALGMVKTMIESENIDSCISYF
jgi:hypothetical protein